MRKNLLIIFIVVLLISFGLISAYFLMTLKTNKKGTVQTPNNFIAAVYYPLNDYYIFKFTFNDEFISKPIQINDVNNKLIATALLSVKANYINGKGEHDSLTIPLVIQKQNGDIIAFGNQKAKQFPTDYIPQFIQFLKDNGKWQTGQEEVADIAVDLDSVFAKNPDLAGSQNLISDVVRQYQNGREKDLQNFLKTGDSKIGLLIPILVIPGGN